MAKYRCPMCGWIYDEEAEGAPISALERCPLCGTAASEFYLVEEDEDRAALDEVDQVAAQRRARDEERARAAAGAAAAAAAGAANAAAGAPVSAFAGADAPNPLAVAPALRRDDPARRHMATIHALAETGGLPDAAMATDLPLPSWDDILLLGAQLAPMPLAEDAAVDISCVIGPDAARPLHLAGPAFVSHMSFGALSCEAKVALARGAAAAGTATCSGEGGILPDELAAAQGRYIFEYAPLAYSATDENLRAAGAVEIKVGQGTKPGMGGHLPGEKVTPEIARIRGRQPGEDIVSPSTIPGVESVPDLRRLVEDLRRRSGGAPVGIKLAAGHIERDVAAAVEAGADFITIDGRGGATGASPAMLRDASSVPTVYALARARRELDRLGSRASLVITGGLRVAADIAKALALGADAVALATASLMALGCQQHRICGSGLCPMGIATQDPELRARLDVDAAAARVQNFYQATFNDLRMFCRVTGHARIADLALADLVTTNRDMADYCGIPHAGAAEA